MARLRTILLTCLSVALLCSTLLGFLSSTFWAFDLFNHFRVQFIVGGLIGFLAALVSRSNRLVWTFAITALINSFLIAPLFFSRPRPSEFQSHLSILSYNTWINNDDWASVQTTLRDGNPDVMYLTETHPSFQKQLEALKVDFHLFQQDSDALFVRRQADLSPVLIETQDLPGIAIQLTISGHELTLIGIHPPAPLSATQAKARDQSFAEISSFLAARGGLKIVVGDFNATPWSRPFRTLQDEANLVNSQRGFGIQPTWPSYPNSPWNLLLRIPIDHCLHSPDIHTVERRVGDHVHSNHNPVFVRLGISDTSHE